MCLTCLNSSYSICPISLSLLWSGKFTKDAAMKSLLIGILASLLCVSSLASDKITRGLEYRDAVLFVGGCCSAVCVSPDGIYISANHCEFKIGQTYETNVLSPGRLKCIYNTGKKEGVCVLIEENTHPPRTYLPVAERLPQIGESVYAIGFPAGRFNYAEAQVKKISNDLNDGNAYITINQRLFEGHSGGPLINERDQVIGVLSTRTFLPMERPDLPDEFVRPEANFLGVESIHSALKESNFGLDNVGNTPKNTPNIIVFTTPGCIPCNQFKNDLTANKFPAEYQFIINEWNGVSWKAYRWDRKNWVPVEKSSYSVDYVATFKRSIRGYPTFWIEGTSRDQLGYQGDLSLIGFIQDVLKSIMGMIFGQPERSDGIVPQIPDPGNASPDFSLIEKIGEIKGKIDAIENVVGSLSEKYEKVKEIKAQIDSVIAIIQKIKGVENGFDVSELIVQLNILKNRVQDTENGIDEVKNTDVSQSLIDKIPFRLILMKVLPSMGIPFGGAIGVGVTGLVWYLRNRKKKKTKPTSDTPNPVKVEPTTCVPAIKPNNDDCLRAMEQVLNRMNQLEVKLNKPPINIPVPVENPPIRETIIKQEYVPYESDEYRKAMAFAKEELVKKYPAAVGSVEYLDSIVEQYLNKVKDNK